METKKIECKRTHDIICPHCGYEFNACGEDYVDGGDVEEKYCDECENDFYLITNYSIPTFSSYKKEDEAHDECTI